MTRYYVDESGAYIGGFDGVSHPNGAVEVFTPPNDGRDTWDGVGWVAYTRTHVERRTEAYACIGDQLDMQYHDAINGTTTWLDHIAAVKAAHPKP